MKTSSEYLLDTSKTYSIYVCETRAIPKVSDGLKDGQRKALWLVRNKAEKIKVISLAGEMISSELYLHGDASAAQTISLMAAPYCNNIPLLDGKGTFGTRVSPIDGIGAPRYIYVQKGKSAENLIFTDLDLVPLKDNHDGSKKEPITFLPLIPTVLLNGVSGIAVGWATSILPRSLNSLIDATIAAIEEKPIKRIDVSYDYLNINVKYVDTNTWEFVGKIEIKDTSTIIVRELPPDLSLKKFKEFLISLEENDLINDWSDKSTKHIDIEIKFLRGSIKDWTEAHALEFLKLYTRKKERIVVIDWNNDAIRQYEDAESLVVDFVKWRLGWFTKRYEKLLVDTEYEIQFWNAVKICFENDLPSKLIKMQNKSSLIKEVMSLTETLLLDEKQIDKIVSFPSYRWTSEHYNECIQMLDDLDKKRNLYVDLLNNPHKIKNIYKQEVLALKKVKFK